jgi:hypothetical protein
MSRSLTPSPRAGLLLAAFAWEPAFSTISVFAQQSYVWRNVEIVGGGFVPGIVFSRPCRI